MRTYVKIEGKDVELIVQKLAKLAVDFPEICVWDMNILDLGWTYPSAILSAGTRARTGAYFGMDEGAFDKHCDRIISKTGGDLGDANIYFEWLTMPSDDELKKLRNLIDSVLKPFGNKYYVTNKN